MRLGARQGASLLIYRRSGYRGRLYATCRHDEIDKSHKSTQTLGKPPLTFARAIARKHAHGMQKAARRLTELASAHPGHAKTPAKTYRAVRSAPPPDRGCDGDFEFVDSGSCECLRLQGVVGDEWNGAPFDRIRRCPHPFMTDKVQRFATRCTMCHLGSLKIPIAICGISGGNIFPMVCRINFQRRSHLLHTGTYRDPR